MTIKWRQGMLAVVLLGTTMSAQALASSVYLQGKLWIVGINTAISPFSVPSATPDATFTTEVPEFGAEGPTVDNTKLNVG